jgi:hypothetical protein
MNNPIVATASFGPVYKRKIHVYREPNELDTTKTVYQYVWSANAYRTCRDAIAAAVAKHPTVKFKASFAKD